MNSIEIFEVIAYSCVSGVSRFFFLNRDTDPPVSRFLEKKSEIEIHVYLDLYLDLYLPALRELFRFFLRYMYLDLYLDLCISFFKRDTLFERLNEET